MKYDKILFDLDNTVIDFDSAESNGIRLTFEDFGIPFEKKYFESFHEINDNLWKMLEKGLVDRPTLIKVRFEKLFELYNVKGISPIEFNERYLVNLSKGRKLIDGASDTIKEVFNLGAKCYFITNGAIKVQKNRLIGQPFMDYISGICISESVGAKKPDKAFFDKAEELFRIKFDNKTLVVGDSLSSDIQGGINAGLDTCYVNRKREKNLSSITPTYEIYDIKELINIVK